MVFCRNYASAGTSACTTSPWRTPRNRCAHPGAWTTGLLYESGRRSIMDLASFLMPLSSLTRVAELMQELHDECGIAAIYHLESPTASKLLARDGPEHVTRLMARMLLDLQNRGQLAAG